MPPLVPLSPQERAELSDVLGRVKDFVQRGETIMLDVSTQDNLFGGRIGEYRYQFEGEEDLLHLIVSRNDGATLAPEEGQSVASVVLKGVPPGMVWFKPGIETQHFYLGHELLVQAL